MGRFPWEERLIQVEAFQVDLGTWEPLAVPDLAVWGHRVERDQVVGWDHPAAAEGRRLAIVANG